MAYAVRAKQVGGLGIPAELWTLHLRRWHWPCGDVGDQRTAGVRLRAVEQLCSWPPGLAHCLVVLCVQWRLWSEFNLGFHIST